MMKVVILAGGYGTRISEESQYKPKPMVEVGGYPILWHIMKEYSNCGFNDFVICAGYKQHVIKEWFADYYLHNTDVTFNLKTNDMVSHKNYSEPWIVTVADTGLNTMTGGRVKRIKKYVDGEPFLLTYGDGVADINISELVAFHKSHGKLMTLSAYNAEQRFGILEMDDEGKVKAFREKAKDDSSLVNMGYMVCQPEVIDFIQDDSTVFEKEPLERIAAAGELVAYKHQGFWQCMDTIREKQKLEEMWADGTAPWKMWSE